MNNSLPYKVFYSVGDEHCKKCLTNIQAGRLQMAIMVQVNWFEKIFYFQFLLPTSIKVSKKFL